MSTAEERQSRAKAIDAAYEKQQLPVSAAGNLESIEQACEDAMVEMLTSSVQNLRAAIRLVSQDESAGSAMRRWAELWLRATEHLIAGAAKVLKNKARRKALITAKAAHATDVPASQTT